MDWQPVASYFTVKSTDIFYSVIHGKYVILYKINYLPTYFLSFFSPDRQLSYVIVHSFSYNIVDDIKRGSRK